VASPIIGQTRGPTYIVVPAGFIGAFALGTAVNADAAPATAHAATSTTTDGPQNAYRWYCAMYRSDGTNDITPAIAR
jgi:hypothetical protein